MKSKLLPILLILLVLLNGFLIFMLIKKPHENRKQSPNRNFLIEQLQFSENQKSKFRDLDSTHRDFIEGIEEEIREEKNMLFSSFADETVNSQENIKKIATLEAKKEAELYRFFSAVRRICTKNQVDKFDHIIKEALKGGNRRPPREGRMHPPEDGNHPPPPR